MGDNFFIPMKYINLIVMLLIIAVTFIAPMPVSAYKEAGSSASVSAKIQSISNNYTDLAIKRKVIYDILSKKNSPLVSEVDAFIATCTKYEIDCYLLPSITGLESSFGKYTHPGSHNAFGWGGGYIVFDSWAECIDAVGKGIRQNYIDKWGATSIETMGPIYAESPTWAVRVRSFHDTFVQLEAEKQLYFSNLTVEL